MGMNIKEPQVHAMARELASRRGTRVADAVRQVLAAELSRSTQPSADARKASRLEAIHQLQARFAALPYKDPRSSDALQNELDDDNELPI